MAGAAAGRVDKPHAMLAMTLAGIGFLGLLVVMLFAFRSPTSSKPTSNRTASPTVGITAPIPVPVPLPTPAPTPVPTPEIGSSSAHKVRVLRDNRLGFQIEMPGDWVNEPDGDGHSLSPPDDSPDSTEISGMIKFAQRGRRDTLRTQAEMAMKELQDLPQLMIESEANVPISGNTAVRIVYHYFQPAAECTYFGITIIAERPEGFSHLAFHGLDERRQLYQPVIEQMIHSFRLTPIAKP